MCICLNYIILYCIALYCIILYYIILHYINFLTLNRVQGIEYINVPDQLYDYVCFAEEYGISQSGT